VNAAQSSTKMDNFKGDFLNVTDFFAPSDSRCLKMLNPRQIVLI